MYVCADKVRLHTHRWKFPTDFLDLSQNVTISDSCAKKVIHWGEREAHPQWCLKGIRAHTSPRTCSFVYLSVATRVVVMETKRLAIYGQTPKRWSWTKWWFQMFSWVEFVSNADNWLSRWAIKRTILQPLTQPERLGLIRMMAFFNHYSVKP